MRPPTPLKKHRVLTLALCLTGIAPSLWAAFNIRHVSARSAGMGNAFLASTQESAALFTNPAGLADIPSVETSLLYGKLQTGIPGAQMGAGLATIAWPTRAGRFGTGYALFQSPGALREEALALSFALPLPYVNAGVTVKRLTRSYLPGEDSLAEPDPVFARGRSKSATALDAGVTIPIGQWLRLGAAVRNINEPNIGIATEDKVLREVQAGAVLYLSRLGIQTCGDIFLKKDARSSDTAPRPFFGAEKSFSKTFALRAGINSNEYTAGMGFRKGPLGLDYAVVIGKSLQEDGLGSHKIGVTYRLPSKKQ